MTYDTEPIITVYNIISIFHLLTMKMAYIYAKYIILYDVNVYIYIYKIKDDWIL